VGRYEEARKIVEAAEGEAEVKLRVYLAALQEEGSFDVAHLDYYAHEVGHDTVDEASDDVLELINDQILDVVFDRRAVDPESLAEDPKGAYLTQIVSAYGDYLGEHLLRLLSIDRLSFVATGLGETRRSRLSPLAAQDDRLPSRS
jgi:hypothetical protein